MAQESEEDGGSATASKQALIKQHKYAMDKKEREIADMRKLLESI